MDATAVFAVGPVVITSNENFSARHTTVTFDRAGSYQFTGDFRWAPIAVVSFTIAAGAARTGCAAGAPQVMVGTSQPFTACLFDQFNRPMNAAATWSVTGAGSIDANGMYQAGAAIGSATVLSRQADVDQRSQRDGDSVGPRPTVATPTPISANSGRADLSASLLMSGGVGATRTWSVVTQPAGTASGFSSNRINSEELGSDVQQGWGLYVPGDKQRLHFHRDQQRQQDGGADRYIDQRDCLQPDVESESYDHDWRGGFRSVW